MSLRCRNKFKTKRRRTIKTIKLTKEMSKERIKNVYA
jgi:hypothetical protein